MRPTMNDSNNCDNCRFRENRSNISSPCYKCSTSLCVHVIGIDLSPAVGPRAYSVKELAKKLGVSEDTIRRDIQKGKYPTAKKENGKWVIYFPLGKVEANV
jgi:excisionase family DNA binding protein